MHIGDEFGFSSSTFVNIFVAADGATACCPFLYTLPIGTQSMVRKYNTYMQAGTPNKHMQTDIKCRKVHTSADK